MIGEVKSTCGRQLVSQCWSSSPDQLLDKTGVLNVIGSNQLTLVVETPEGTVAIASKKSEGHTFSTSIISSEPTPETGQSLVGMTYFCER